MLTLKESAALVNRDIRTIQRWKRDGVNVHDEAALHQHADFMEIRSVGKTAQMLRDLPSGPSASAPSAFFDASRALAALDTLARMQDAFQKRLDRAKAVGDEHEVGMIGEELGYLAEAHRLLSITLEGHELI